MPWGIAVYPFQEGDSSGEVGVPMVDRRRGTIVIADADQHGREQASEVLRRSGYETVAVDTGVAALDAVRAGDVALVLLEVALPEISGYAVLRIVRDNDPDIAVIFLSGSRTDPLHRVAGLLLGADDFITKPFNSDELGARVERFVTRHAAAPREPAREQRHQRAA